MTKLVATGVQFPDATIQTTVATPIGSGQTWQNVIGSRTNGATYTNSTGRSIQVGVRVQNTASITVNGVAAAVSSINDAANFLGAIIPNGNTYVVSSAAGIANWDELR